MKCTAHIAAGLLAAASLQAQDIPPQYVTAAPRFAEAPKIDGDVDEPVWREAAVLRDFIQLEPDNGEPGTEETEVLIGYDEKMLYIAGRFHYEDPSQITSNFMDRDANLVNDDSIQVVIDTFGDGRNGFLFGVNPTGAQVDALVRGEGDDVNYGWDSVWYSGTSRSAAGWSVELAIPFRVLRFSQTDVHSWGFNVMRTKISPEREAVVWRPNELSALRNGLFKLSQAGLLTGLEEIRQGRQYEVKPYVLARAERSDIDADDEDLEVGVDFKKNLSSNLTLDLTYNLDFSEVEADNQEVNLTRFKLFFPEKRDFFQEGSSLFYFGDRGDALKSTERIFFFSRQIGLTGDGQRTVPVLGGVKLSGKVKRTSLGVLNLTTEDLDYVERGTGEARRVAQTNFSVLRLKQDIFKKSSVGFMWLNKEVDGGRDNSGAGVDWDFALGDHFKSGGFLAQTSTPGISGDDWAGMADIVWESESVFAKGSYADVREGFNPEMGFFPRIGVREWRGNVSLVTKPEFWNLREVWFVEDYLRVTDQQGNLESEVNRLETDLVWRNYVLIALKYFDQTEVVKSPFEIHPGVFIQPGEYHAPNYFLGFQTVPGKPVFFFGRIQGGDLYDGTFETRIAGFRLRPRKGLHSRIFYEHTDVELPQAGLPKADFTVELLSVNVTYSISPRLSSRALLEWRSDDNLSANLSVKWIYKPGAAFYVVYNELRDLMDRPGSASTSKDRSLTVKATFYF